MPFDPATDITGKLLWLRAKDNGSGGSSVSTWTDQSGLSNTFTSSGTAPTVAAASTPGGGKSVRFQADGQLNLASPAGVITATASSSYPTEQPINALDGNAATHWTTNGVSSATLQYQFAFATVKTGYKIRRRDDIPNRNPKDWTFQGSNNGSSWTTLDTRTGITWGTAGETKTFSFSNTTAYLYYRLNVSANNGDTYLSVTNMDMTPEGAELWVVAKVAASGVNASWYFNNATSGSHYQYTDGKIYESFGERGSDRESFTPGVALTSWRLYRVANDGTTWESWLDNTSQATASNKSIQWLASNWTIAVNPSASGANRFNGYIAEMLIRDRVSTSTEVADLIAYFNTEHGLSVSGGTYNGVGAVTNPAVVGSSPIPLAAVPNVAAVTADQAAISADVPNPAQVSSAPYPVGGVTNPAGVVADPVTVFTASVPNPATVSGDFWREAAVTNPARVGSDPVFVYDATIPNPAGVSAAPIPVASVPNPAHVDSESFGPISGDASTTFTGHGDDAIVTTFATGASSFTTSGHGDTPTDGEYATGGSSMTFRGTGAAQFRVTVNPQTKRPDYRLILVQPDGTHRKQLVDAVIGDRDWVLGGRGGLTFTIPRTSPSAGLVHQYDHVQVWVGAELLPEAWFVIVDPVKDAGPDLEFQCSGLRWLLEGLRIGKERPNLLANGGFEEDLKYWHGAYYAGSASPAPPVQTIVTGSNALDGGKALQVEAVESVVVIEHETAAIFKGNRPYAWDSPQSDGYLAGGPAIVLDLVKNFASDATITIEGFTADVDGGDGLELSQRRADLAKATILAEHPDMHITAIGRGETIQVASNATPAGQAKNRRIVITGTSTKVGHRQATVRWQLYTNPTTERVPIALELDGWIDLIHAVGPSKDGWGLYIDRRPVGGYADTAIIDTAHTELDPAIFPLNRWTLDGCSIDAPADGVEYLYNVRLYGTAGTTRFDAISLKPNLKTSWYNVHHSTAIGKLVEHAQDTAYGKTPLGIENQCGPIGPVDDFEYWWKDHTVVDDAIDEILRADDAPDFWIACTPDRKIAKTAARRGRFTGMVFTYGENVASYTSTVAGDKVATTAFAVSNGTEGGGRAEAVYRTGTVNGLVLERLETTGPNLYPSRLRERAKAMTRYGRADVITSVTLKSSATAGLIGALVPGDTITVQVDDGGLDADGNYRIVGIGHSFAKNQLSFDLVPEV